MTRLPRFLIPAVFFVFFCTDTTHALRQQYEFSGRTMGTYYTVKFISKKNEPQKFWQTRIDTLLRQINRRLSMYDPKSELSVFNNTAPGQPHHLSTDFHAVLTQADTLYTISGGAWDGTIKPLVDLWGFGVSGRDRPVPGKAQIDRARSFVGFHRIRLQKGLSVVKEAPVTLDLGSIAKGYGVDALLAIILDSGIDDALVEIGGELSAAGKNRKREPWTVGINRPDKSFANRNLIKIVQLNRQAIATSGDYRNFFEQDGKTYSHIIDPRTGYPTVNHIVSASVVANNCTFADGLATALMVMDTEEGIALVNQTPDTECLIIREQGDQLIEHASHGFEDLLVK